jgi:glycosyltransferase involved in cell wall biosynthesis
MPPRTGVGRHTESLLRSLASQAAIEHITLLLSVLPFGKNWASSARAIERLHLNADLYRLPCPYGWVLSMWHYFQFPRMDSILPSLDLVHGPAHVLPAVSKAKGVLTVHDTTLLEHPEWYPKAGRVFARQIVDGVQRADRIIVPSHFVKKRLEANAPGCAQKIRVIHHDIYAEGVEVSIKEKALQRKKLFTADFPYLFWNGEMNPRKNVTLLFEILAGLRKGGFPDLKLVLCGTLGYQAEVILQALDSMGLRLAFCSMGESARDGDVLHLGYVTDAQLRDLLACSEVYVFPSLDEGFGYPVVEAMASGIPVVCSSLGSLPEICGDSAVLLDPTSGAESYIEAIASLLNDPHSYRLYQARGRERQGVFRTDSMGKKTLTVYKEALES